jgi:trimethylamine:corrinoid methyltransferase-like protein
LGHFADILISNGYDDIRFIHETTEDELEDVGVTSSKDRALLLKAFKAGFQ